MSEPAISYVKQLVYSLLKYSVSYIPVILLTQADEMEHMLRLGLLLTVTRLVHGPQRNL